MFPFCIKKTFKHNNITRSNIFEHDIFRNSTNYRGTTTNENRADPDQTALEAVWSGFSLLAIVS